MDCKTREANAPFATRRTMTVRLLCGRAAAVPRIIDRENYQTITSVLLQKFSSRDDDADDNIKNIHNQL